MNKTNIVWILRVLVFALFVFSAIAKMFPLWAFEKQLVDLGLMSWCNANYFARILIAIELALGIAIIQPHFLKRLVLPSTILLLIVFCIHLVIEMVKHGAMNGNCGCFGQLVPMTPLEAFVKNILTLGILFYIYINVKDKPSGQNRFSVLLVITAISTLVMFMLFPFCPCQESSSATSIIDETEVLVEELDTTMTLPVESPTASVTTSDTVKLAAVDSIKEDPGPAQVKSRFSADNIFDGKKVNLDKGRKILCFFAPGCNHCQDAAKELAELSNDPDFPKVYIYFMDEESSKIPEFHKIAGKQFPSVVLDIPKFWTLLGAGSTPGIFYMWNGNIIKDFEGTGDNAYSKSKLLQHVHSNKKGK
ncbi:MAG: MauE/DoxX family redox-associated membrane protein [Bacteroidota bacterium]